MDTALRYEIKSRIYEIERLLGPSFPLKTFAMALRDELRLMGVMTYLETANEKKEAVILKTEDLTIVVDDTISSQLKQVSDSPAALWFPHKYLIFPENSKAVA